MKNVKLLPDAYYKGKDGNNYKLLLLNNLATEEYRQELTNVLESLDLLQATGKTLDLFGETVNQQRGILNDTQYRILILTKIGKNICQGDYNSIIKLLTIIFECEPCDIHIKECDEICRVEIDKFPLDVLARAGFSSTQAVEILEQLLPVCVKVADANFEGTFEFGEIAPYTYPLYRDKEKGFGDIEQTVGGYFGLTLGDANNFVLPL